MISFLSVALDLTIHDGKWTKQIEENLKLCEDYILLISQNDDLMFTDLTNDWYYKEIELAIQQNKNIIIIATDGIDFTIDLPDAISSLKDYEVIWYNPLYFETIINKLFNFLNESSSYSEERVGNKYDTVRFEASKRLKEQQILFEEANNAIYDQILKNKLDFHVLDLGCNNGDFAKMHFLDRKCCAKVIGVDVSEQIFEHIIENSKFFPFLLDCEADDFIDLLYQIMDSLGIKHFDLINISFLLLHLKNPDLLLYRIRELLSPDGFVFIRDIDDSFIISYPDENNYIQRLTEMNNYCLHTGNRNTGRQIYTSLANNGYDNIVYIPEDFSTANATKAQRKRLFYVNYSYIAENVLDMVNIYSTNKRYQEDYDWIKKNITNIERMFSHKQYFYKMGVIAFIAQYLD